MDIKAYVVHEKNGPYQLETVQLDDPKEGEVLVRNVASGICHTDEFGRSQGVPIVLPLVLGHEGAGVVEKVGPGVTEFAPGDHVGFSYAFCGHCDPCHEHEPYYCDNFNAINFGGTAPDGTTRLHQDGQDVSMFFGQSSFATYSVVNAQSVVKADPEIDLAMVAPVGCGIQTGAGAVLNVAHATEKDTVAVYGCGAVGFSAIMAARVAGCKKIIAVGRNDAKLALAAELGATDVVNSKKTDPVEAVRHISDGGATYGVETTGVGPCINQAIQACKYHGTLLALGASGVIDNFNFGYEVMMQMRTVKGSCEGESDIKTFIPQLLDLYKRGEFPIDKIITVYPFAEIDRALQETHDGKAIKAVLRM